MSRPGTTAAAPRVTTGNSVSAAVRDRAAARITVLACIAAGIAGCAVGPDYAPPETLVEPGFDAAGSPEVGGMFGPGEPERDWWERFEDPTLTRLVELALRENYDLRIAAANVREARALLVESRFELFPIVTAEASAARVRQPGAADSTFTAAATVYDAGLDAAWELDIFGGVRREIDARVATLGAVEAELRDVQVTVAGEVARTYAELRGNQLRLEVAERNAENQRRTYELTQALLEGGRGTDLDIARAAAQLESTLATIPPLETGIASAIHRLGVLVGQRPGSLRADLAAASRLPSSAMPVAIGDPASLLRRRPDVRAAERGLAVTIADTGIAVADLFPRVSVVASGGYAAFNAGDLGDPDTERFSIGPVITWPAFDLFRLRNRVRAADARADAALAVYERTVSAALEETETALVRYAQARRREARLRTSSAASEKAAELARLRYRNGVDSFLTVLDAERRLLEAQDLLASSETETLLALVALYKSFGGGWEVAPTAR